MPIKTNTAKRILVYISLAVIIILAGFLLWRYFKNSSAEETPLAGEQAAESIKQIGEIQLEISQPGGKEILDLLLVLQKIKLDIDFFQDEKFQNLTDFYKEIKISEEEKGNSRPFR